MSNCMSKFPFRIFHKNFAHYFLNSFPPNMTFHQATLIPMLTSSWPSSNAKATCQASSCAWNKNHNVWGICHENKVLRFFPLQKNWDWQTFKENWVEDSVFFCSKKFGTQLVRISFKCFNVMGMNCHPKKTHTMLAEELGGAFQMEATHHVKVETLLSIMMGSSPQTSATKMPNQWTSLQLWLDIKAYQMITLS